MPQLVITCHPNGSVELLLKDRVIDSRKLGERKVERVSIIEFCEETQKFYIVWLKGPLTIPLGGNILPVAHMENGKRKEFDIYEDAVSFEVATVNALRLKGYTFV